MTARIVILGGSAAAAGRIFQVRRNSAGAARYRLFLKPDGRTTPPVVHRERQTDFLQPFVRLGRLFSFHDVVHDHTGYWRSAFRARHEREIGSHYPIFAGTCA